MKKFLIVILASFTAFQASGQDTFGVVYPESNLSEFERGLIELLDVKYMKVGFVGNLKNKRIYVEEIVCRDGEFSTHIVTDVDHPYRDDVKDMQLYIKRISQDSITLKVILGGARFFNRNIALCNENHEIVETGVKASMKDMSNPTPDPLKDTLYYPSGVDIPIMAYSKGVAMGNGWFNLCQLRDALMHPRDWFAKFGIKNYVYYTVRFE